MRDDVSSKSSGETDENASLGEETREEREGGEGERERGRREGERERERERVH